MDVLSFFSPDSLVHFCSSCYLTVGYCRSCDGENGNNKAANDILFANFEAVFFFSSLGNITGL